MPYNPVSIQKEVISYEDQNNPVKTVLERVSGIGNPDRDFMVIQRGDEIGDGKRYSGNIYGRVKDKYIPVDETHEFTLVLQPFKSPSAAVCQVEVDRLLGFGFSVV